MCCCWLYQPQPILRQSPVMVGSNIIDRAMSIITKGKLTKVTMPWRLAHFGAVMSGSLQLPNMGSNETGVEKEVIHSSPRSVSVEVKEFFLDDVRCPVHTTWKVIIPPFSTISVHTNTSAKGHCMWIQVLIEQIPGPKMSTAVVLTVTYGELHLGFLRVPICLCNLGTHLIEISKDCGWPGHACQPSATSGPPKKDFWGIQ